MPHLPNSSEKTRLQYIAEKTPEVVFTSLGLLVLAWLHAIYLSNLDRFWQPNQFIPAQIFFTIPLGAIDTALVLMAKQAWERSRATRREKERREKAPQRESQGAFFLHDEHKMAQLMPGEQFDLVLCENPDRPFHLHLFISGEASDQMGITLQQGERRLSFEWRYFEPDKPEPRMNLVKKKVIDETTGVGIRFSHDRQSLYLVRDDTPELLISLLSSQDIEELWEEALDEDFTEYQPEAPAPLEVLVAE